MSTALPLVDRALRVTLLLLAGCGCPPLREAYDSPAATLATWQAHLCHDDQVGEYRCLSSRLQQQMGGFETYFAARRQLLEEQPLLAWALARADLAERAIGQAFSPDGLTAELFFQLDDGRLVIGFRRETRAFYTLDDGSQVTALQAAPVSELLRQQGARQWLNLEPPRRFTPEDAQAVLSLQVGPQWKIDAIEGLVGPPGAE